MKWQKYYRLILYNPRSPDLLVPLIIINFFGSIYGYYWYRHQLMATDIRFWLFVPDSPLSTTLFTLALLLIIFYKKETWFSGIAYLGVMKYGLWAVIVITHYWIISGNITFTEMMLWFSHLGMAAEGAIYFRNYEVDGKGLAVFFCWLFSWDYMDYIWDLHPYLFDASQFHLALVSAVILSFVLLAWSTVKFSITKQNI